MNRKPHVGLIVVLMMFPQIIETIYSPVLPHLASYFSVPMTTATQTLSVYFVAFALGVVVWGRMADIIGRRNTMLLGLVIYGLGSLLAISAQHFSVILFGVSLLTLPETKPELIQKTSFVSVLSVMSKDYGIWKSAILVACFNIMMFSYYSLAPFIFDKLAMTSMEFGYSGGVLALASVIGSVINRYLLSKNMKADKLVFYAVLFSIIGSIGVYLLQDGLWFLIPLMLIVIGFGMAIPNILSTALVNYKHQAGTAGAILGLFYYLMIGTGLGIAGMVGDLGAVLIMTSLLAGVMVCRKLNSRCS